MGNEEDTAGLRESNPNAGGPEGAEGELGVSSERVGPTGPGQVGTDGVRPVGPTPPEEDAPPEQQPGNDEENPVGIPPKADYPTRDPRSSD